MKSVFWCVSIGTYLLSGREAIAAVVGGTMFGATDSQGPAMLAMAAGFVALGVFRARLRGPAPGRQRQGDTGAL